MGSAAKGRLLKRVLDRAGELGSSFEENFDSRFQRIARDPKVLAFIASSLNYVSASRLEFAKLEDEIAGIRSRSLRAWTDARKGADIDREPQP